MHMGLQLVESESASSKSDSNEGAITRAPLPLLHPAPSSWATAYLVAYLGLLGYITAFSVLRLVISTECQLELQVVYLGIFITCVAALLGNLAHALWRQPLADAFNILLHAHSQSGSGDPSTLSRREKSMKIAHTALQLIVLGGGAPAVSLSRGLHVRLDDVRQAGSGVRAGGANVCNQIGRASCRERV